MARRRLSFWGWKTRGPCRRDEGNRKDHGHTVQRIDGVIATSAMLQPPRRIIRGSVPLVRFTPAGSSALSFSIYLESRMCDSSNEGGRRKREKKEERKELTMEPSFNFSVVTDTDTAMGVLQSMHCRNYSNVNLAW